MKHIKEILSIKASGDNIYRFINAIREAHIVCTSQRCVNGIFFADIHSRDFKRIKSLAESSSVQITVIKDSGLMHKLRQYRFRYGIVLGLMLMLGAVFYFSNTVVTIEVCGSSKVTTAQVMAALEDIGIYKGRFIPDIDFHNAEQRLRLSIPQIAWTGIRHTGSRIIVDITEAVEPPEMVNDNIPCNIVSTKDAQITYTEVYAGQLIKKKGDGVRKGGIIVSGIADDGKGHFLKKHAMGKIRGIYTEKMIFTQPFSISGKVYGEDIQKRKYLDFFGMRIPMFINDPDTETFDYTEQVNNFSMFGIEIPFGIVHCTYEPFKYEKTEYSPEEAEKKLEEKASLYEKNFYGDSDITVLDREINKISNKEEMVFEVTYKLEGDIGEDKEIFADRQEWKKR